MGVLEVLDFDVMQAMRVNKHMRVYRGGRWHWVAESPGTDDKVLAVKMVASYRLCAVYQILNPGEMVRCLAKLVTSFRPSSPAVYCLG
jgi:hypothetical protein